MNESVGEALKAAGRPEIGVRPDGGIRPDGGVRPGRRIPWGWGIRVVRRWARVVIGVGLLALLGWRLGSGPFLTGIRVVKAPTLIAALAIGVVTTVLSAWRWSRVAAGLGMRLPLRDAVGDYYRSLFLNAVLPGGVLGDVHRAVRHGRDVGDVPRGVTAVVLDRCAGQLMLFVVGVTVLVLDPPAPLLPDLLGAGTGAGPGTPAVIGAVATGVVAVAVGLGSAVAVTVRRGTSRRAGTVRGWGRDARAGLLTPGNRLVILVASAGILAGHLSTFVLAARAAGSAAPVGRLLPLMLLALVAMTLPVNIGGWGPREGVTAWAFGAAGLSAAQGLTVAVVYGLFALVASLPGAGVLAGRGIARLRAGRGSRPVGIAPTATPATS